MGGGAAVVPPAGGGGGLLLGLPATDFLAFDSGVLGGTVFPS